MNCPKCGHHFEIVIKEVPQPEESQQSQLEQQPQQVDQSQMLPRQISETPKQNKITDEEFLRAQRILSMAAQGRK